MDNCKVCKVPLEEIKDELCRRADYFGMESLTEEEQVFIDKQKPERCPSCMD